MRPARIIRPRARFAIVRKSIDHPTTRDESKSNDSRIKAGASKTWLYVDGEVLRIDRTRVRSRGFPFLSPFFTFGAKEFVFTRIKRNRDILDPYVLAKLTSEETYHPLSHCIIKPLSLSHIIPLGRLILPSYLIGCPCAPLSVCGSSLSGSLYSNPWKSA